MLSYDEFLRQWRDPERTPAGKTRLAAENPDAYWRMVGRNVQFTPPPPRGLFINEKGHPV